MDIELKAKYIAKLELSEEEIDNLYQELEMIFELLTINEIDAGEKIPLLMELKNTLILELI